MTLHSLSSTHPPPADLPFSLWLVFCLLFVSPHPLPFNLSFSFSFSPLSTQSLFLCPFIVSSCVALYEQGCIELCVCPCVCGCLHYDDILYFSVRNVNLCGHLSGRPELSLFSPFYWHLLVAAVHCYTFLCLLVCF